MKRILFLVVPIAMTLCASAAQAASQPLHPQLAALVNKLNSPPTYGGEFRPVANVSAMDATAAPTRFSFTPEKLQISKYDPDRYVIPASVQVTNLTPAGLIKSVHVAVNGVERGLLEWNVSGIIIDDGVHFAIPLLSGDAGTLRLTATVFPKDGTAPEVSDWDYDVPTCRVPEVITYANPPHGTNFVSFVGDVHGLPRNLMMGFAVIVWSQWPEIFEKFDPNLPRDQWSAIINVSAAKVAFKDGHLSATDQFYPSMKGGYAFLIPTVCGRYVMSDVQPFYTDAAPQMQTFTAGIQIEVIRNNPGQLTESRVTLRRAPRGGWLFSWATGSRPDGWWSYSSGLPALVEAKEDAQERNFEYYTIQSFTYSLRAQYFAVRDDGTLELLMDGSTPQDIPGTMPCWFCGGPGAGSATSTQ